MALFPSSSWLSCGVALRKRAFELFEPCSWTFVLRRANGAHMHLRSSSMATQGAACHPDGQACRGKGLPSGLPSSWLRQWLPCQDMGLNYVQSTVLADRKNIYIGKVWITCVSWVFLLSVFLPAEGHCCRAARTCEGSNGITACELRVAEGNPLAAVASLFDQFESSLIRLWSDAERWLIEQLSSATSSFIADELLVNAQRFVENSASSTLTTGWRSRPFESLLRIFPDFVRLAIALVAGLCAVWWSTAHLRRDFVGQSGNCLDRLNWYSKE